jgi:formiminotetrahydrofolate cyclodeaminase
MSIEKSPIFNPSFTYMKRIIAVVCVLFAFHFTGLTQQTSVSEKQVLVNNETKAALVSKLSFSTETAEKIISIENEFFTSLSQTIGMPEISEIEKKAREKKVHEAHVTRRSKLMELPLTGRQMEDVIELSEAIRRKHKI